MPAASCSTGCWTTLRDFTGPDWEQEDDITLVTLRRASGWPTTPTGLPTTIASPTMSAFSIPGEDGNERLAMDRVAAAVESLGLSTARLERLKTAVREATMNAIEYGSQGRADVPVDVALERHAGGDRRADHRPGAVGLRPRGRRGTRPRREARRRSRSLAAGACS